MERERFLMKIVQFGVSLQGVLVPKLSRIVIPRAVESYFSKISFLTLSLRIIIAMPFSRNRCFQYFRIRSSLVARNISWKIVENRNYTSVGIGHIGRIMELFCVEYIFWKCSRLLENKKEKEIDLSRELCTFLPWRRNRP